MYIKQLQLSNYRNYEKVNIPIHDKMNVIIGENAQGKTNLLEAIYVLAFTRSYRTSKERELVKWGEDFAKINGQIVMTNRTLPLEVLITTKGKKVKLNHLEQRRLSDYVGTLNVVMFSPEDLTLVKGSPLIRRRFMDMELGQIQPSYLYHLAQYQTILRQRNHLLKQIQREQKNDFTLLHILTDQLIEHATIILKRRFTFLQSLQKWAQSIHYNISRAREKLKIQYKPSITVSESEKKGKIKETYQKKFQEIEKKEVDRGVTLIGPHRDDLSLIVNDKDVQRYGSQGQQRTTALSLKLAELDLIHAETGEYPVLLLDDVLSELDDYRQSHLLDAIQGKVQTFVSTTSVDGIHHNTLRKAELFYVKNGNIQKY